MKRSGTPLLLAAALLSGCADTGQATQLAQERAAAREQAVSVNGEFIRLGNELADLKARMLRLQEQVGRIEVCETKTPSGLVVVPCSGLQRR